MSADAKVDFFIVGAPKCGTTSLYSYLRQHPKIYLPESVKEPNYFSSDIITKESPYFLDYVESGVGGCALVRSLVHYHKLFSDAQPYQQVGEASVSYLFYSEVPERIRNYNEDAKIIIMLRDPIIRAHSHYLMDYNFGYFNDSFSEVIRREGDAPSGSIFQQIVELGLYYSQVERYLSHFPRDQVLILFQERFDISPEDSMDQVFSFLGVKSESVNFERSQVYKKPKNLLVKLIVRNQVLKRCFRRLKLPPEITIFLKSLLFQRAAKPVIDAVDRELLRELYVGDVARLSELLKMDLGAIWNDFRVSPDD